MSRTRKILFNRVLAVILSFMMTVGMIPTNVLAAESPSYGTVSTYTGGTITGNGTANVEVLVEETTLEWVEGNELRAEGWWVGIRVDAPEGFSENATYKVKNNPNAEYGEAKSFAAMKDGDSHIQLWFPVSAESIEKFASEGRNLTMTYTFDWNADSEYEQTIVFSVVPSEKIVLKQGGEQVDPEIIKYGTVSTYTGGTVSGNGTANVEVLVEETTLEWVEGNELRAEGWWVGIRVDAPEGFSENATYKVKNNPNAEYGEAKSFAAMKDGDSHIQLWFPVSAESIEKFASEGRNLTMTYTFDWNADSEYEQTIVFSVVPSEKIVLMKEAYQVYPVLSANVTVEKNEGGYVALNGNVAETVTVNHGSEVDVVVTATEGYGIASVVIGGEEQEVTVGSSEFKTIIKDIRSEKKIEVSFVKVYTVSVTISGNGKADMIPAGEGGAVTVQNGTVVAINATPDENHRVTAVKINGADEDVSGENSSGYETNLTADKEYNVEITFSPNIFSVTAADTMNGTVKIEQASVEYGRSTKVVIEADEGYIAESVKVNDEEVEVKTDDEKDEHYIELTDITENKTVVVSFKLIEGAIISDVSINDEAALRVGENGTLYIINKGDSIVFSTKKQGIMLWGKQYEWLGSGWGQPVSISDNKTIERIQLFYQDAKEGWAQWHDVAMSPIKIVVDETPTEVTNISTNPEVNANGYYNSDVEIDIIADDGEYYSGIQMVRYWINGNEEAAEIIYEYAEGTPQLRKYTTESPILIDASVYNSAGVTVTIEITDLAGNVKTVDHTLNINTTKPTVSLDIDGTQNEGALEGYYNDKRVLTITINDREDTFSAKNVASGLKIYKNGELITVDASDIVWEHNDDLHVGKYTFEEDAHYVWSFSYTNLADMSSDGVTAPEDKAIYDFYVDKAEPYNLKVSYEPTVADVLLETITFGFYKPSVEVIIEATDDTAGIEQFVFSYDVDENVSSINVGRGETIVNEEDITYDGNTATTSFVIDEQFRGKVTFSATDRAGRRATYTEEKTVVVDTIAPGITVAYDNNDVYNGKYYRADRTATITIEEANFFVDDTKDGLLVISRTKVLNDGTRIEEVLSPEFTKNGDAYTTEILFDENADYTFDIEYTDRAGNKYDSYPMDEFTIDKINPIVELSYSNNACVNGNQFSESRTATVKVTEHNFSVEGIVAKVNGAEYGLTWSAVAGEDDTYEAEVLFSDSGHYKFEISGVDLAENINEGVEIGNSVAPWEFTVDSSGPQDLKITYEPAFVETVLEAITFGFYEAPVKVTIEASDDVAGMDYFTYSYTVQEGASTINVGAKDVVVDVDGTTATATFEIPAQFRGCVSFTATNNAGVSTSYVDERVIVIDTIAPSVTVEYENNNSDNEKYFDADRTATIKITEANFFVQDIEDGRLVITVGKTDDNGTYTEINIDPEFVKVEDVYTATYEFDENADYTFDIKYTDRAGQVFDSYEMDEFTIDKIKPQISMELADGAYFNANRKAKITVVEHNFCASDFVFNVEAKDVTGTKSIDLTAKDYATYLKNIDNWTQVAADTWEIEIVFDIEGNYTVNATYSDLAGNAQVSPVNDNFCIDKSKPENVAITYEPSFVGTVFEAITLGFYNAPITVKIEATDEYAGIDYFAYTYQVEDDASNINSGKSDVIVKARQIAGTNKSTASFEIPAQFRGKVSVTAFDKSANSWNIEDDKAVVVDDKAPEIDVVYDNNSALYTNYYNADRNATITITEANFFGTEEWDYADLEEELLMITVEKTLNDGTYTATKMKPEFTKEGDVYTANLFFDENADYTFDITYTDRSGNVYDSYEMDEFSVDKISPIIEVSYDNNTCNNENQFNADREATIVITEHNFNASDVIAKVMASGIEETSYAEYLADDTNWNHEGDVHTAKIQYKEEAHYTFEISYTDMAGNANEGVDYGTSVAPEEFTLDKSAPTELDIRINDVSVVGSMETLVFDKFYDQEVIVELSAECDISGQESFKYQKVASVSEYDEEGVWTDYNAETGIVVSPSEKFIIYFRAEDRAGNVSIVRTTGIIVDNQKPSGEQNAPEIDIIPASPNANNLYKGNVNVRLKVVDPKYVGIEESDDGHYAGLNKVTCRIYTTDTKVVTSMTLMDITNGVITGAEYDEDDLVSAWSGNIVIDSELFNSNNVMVEITAIDNTGNSRTTTTKAGAIQIDTTEPKIQISYNNNEVDNEKIFKADRTATIVVTERNFKPQDVQIALTNTDGVIPALSDWTRSAGTGNQDDTKWTATITYSADGDYEFGLSYVDMAGNPCAGVEFVNSVAPTAFTIDKTLPVIAVTYDNKDVKSGYYYKKDRVATINITEHNFDAARVSISLAATDDGATVDVPVVSKWVSNGDRHTATIHYANDAKYTFDIAMTDMAGNMSAEYAEETFIVDKTAPTLTITGVLNNSANSGDVIPVISYSDTNYDAQQVVISLIGANRRNVETEGTYTDIHNGRIFTFNNFAIEKEVDDIYTLAASLTDKAGNVTTESITFSVNRFGSTYALSKETEALNGTYIQKPEDVIVTETNANKLVNIKITLFKNNETIVLTEGNDYRIDIEGGNGEWYRYTYTVFDDNFEDDGVYRLTFHSEDAAGNVAENTLDTKEKEISLGVDKTKPNIVVANLESDVTYAMENLVVKMSVNDNLLLSSVTVYLDDYGREFKTWKEEELDSIISESGEFTFEVAGDSKGAHKVKIVCVDAAGNEQIEEITNFYVTTDILVRYYNNKPLFFGSIGGVVLVAGLFVFLVVYKKKKNETK